MSTSLLDLALNLLLGAAASIGQPAAAAQDVYPATGDTRAGSAFEAAASRRQARGARVSLTDPYYSFRRTRRSDVRD